MMNRKKRTLLLLLLTFFLCSHFAFAQSRKTAHTLKLDKPENIPAATIKDMAWLAGHFRSKVFGGISEEVWTPPFGKTMMGMFKLVKGDKIVFYELFTISEESNSLILKLKHFNPDLTGW